MKCKLGGGCWFLIMFWLQATKLWTVTVSFAYVINGQYFFINLEKHAFFFPILNKSIDNHNIHTLSNAGA